MNIVDKVFPGRAAAKKEADELREKVKAITQDIGKEAEAVLAEVRAEADRRANEKDRKEAAAHKGKGG